MQPRQEWVDVVQVIHFPSDSMQTLVVDGQAVVVFNLDGHFYGLKDCCTHDGGDLSSGTLAGGEIICPRHGARFDVKTGMVRTPPAYEDVDVVEVRVHNDKVQVKR